VCVRGASGLIQVRNTPRELRVRNVGNLGRKKAFGAGVASLEDNRCGEGVWK